MPASAKAQQERRHTESAGQKRRLSPAANETITPAEKKHKRDHQPIPPPEFWDGLSKIPLTRNALRELGRRTRRKEPCCSRIATTSNKVSLERFARQGGPNLTDLRGCQIPARFRINMSSSQSSLGRRKRGSQSPVKRIGSSPSKSTATSNSTSIKSVGPYDRAFQQNLIDHNIFPDGYEYPDGTSPPGPDNMDEILHAMAQPRASLSPSQFSDNEFKSFKRADTHAFKERDITTNVIPFIEGTNADRKCVAGDVPFTNLESLTDGTIVAGKPDLYYDSRPEELDIRVRREQSCMLVPSSQSDLPILPNFTLEAKGPDGTLSVATRQSCYNGALGARGMQSLQSYGHSALEYDNKAYTISTIYQGGQLKMFTCHPIPPRSPGERCGFVTTQIDTWGLTGNANKFREGVTAFRNARDWAKQQRDATIDQANEMAKRRSSLPVDSLGLLPAKAPSSEDMPSTSQETVTVPHTYSHKSHYDSDTSADELSLNFDWLANKSRSGSPRKKR
ncbi:hypothetical protein MAJ_09784, partial [Metarhizium majus ARSEF 297]